MTQPLYLCKDVFFCVTDGHGVFLDLKHDEYSAIPLSRCCDEVSDREVDAGLALHRQTLLEQHMLTETEITGRQWQAYRSIARATDHVMGPDDERAFGDTGLSEHGRRLLSGDFVDFFLASRKATRLLRHRHIRDIVAGVRVRKNRQATAIASYDAIRCETRIFRKLRPLYPRGYLCLFDSLALVEFLARRGLFPTWVFGVQVKPFGAHCWLQVDGHLINESCEYAGQFTPIMAV